MLGKIASYIPPDLADYIWLGGFSGFAVWPGIAGRTLGLGITNRQGVARCNWFAVSAWLQKQVSIALVRFRGDSEELN